MQNLMQNPVYTFFSATNDDGARFLLHFGGAFSIGENAKKQSITVYASGNTVYIANTSGNVLKGDVYVYNTMGQTILQQKLTGENQMKITLNASIGYYLVKVVTNENAYSTKVFVK
ncbi:MAG: T9SS type A sorting domain-containing protein [Bacteroidetes bacterium]|nr:T9SS type A sorting domain-containing protein [Bacteroidota bacterium]